MHFDQTKMKSLISSKNLKTLRTQQHIPLGVLGEEREEETSPRNYKGRKERKKKKKGREQVRK